MIKIGHEPHNDKCEVYVDPASVTSIIGVPEANVPPAKNEKGELLPTIPSCLVHLTGGQSVQVDRCVRDVNESLNRRQQQAAPQREIPPRQ